MEPENQTTSAPPPAVPPRPKNRRLFILIFSIFAIILIIIGVFIKKQEPNNVVRSDEVTLTKDGYSLIWNKETRETTVTKGNEQVASFKLYRTPREMYAYPPRNILLIAVGEKHEEMSNGFEPRDWYLSIPTPNNNKSLLHYVFSEEKFDMGNETRPELLSSRLEPIRFSPDGKYIFAAHSFWEGFDPVIISTENFNRIKVDSSDVHFIYTYWHPSLAEKCILDINVMGMYGPEFKIEKIENDIFAFEKFKLPESFKILDFDSDKTTVEWNKDCSGKITFIAINADSNKELTKTYKFNLEKKSLIETVKE
ncbi:MAG: hypothetical protein Q8P91_03760 [bacterium]|nr:hypothetical protein [bacterium]